MVLQKTLESPLDCKEIQPVNPKEISPEYSLEGLMLKLQYFGHMMWRGQLIGIDPDAGKDERQKEKKTEDEMIRYNHGLNGHKFEQTPGDSGG